MKLAISFFIAEFACAKLAKKFSDVNRLDSLVVIYLYITYIFLKKQQELWGLSLGALVGFQWKKSLDAPRI